MINIPDLIRKWLVVVDESVDLILQRTDSHGVGHANGKRMMKLHLLLDIFQMLIFDEKSSSRVMLKERRAVEYFIVMEHQYFIFPLGVATNLFKSFEFKNVGVCHLFNLNR